jgi:hypothetical protein
MTEQSFTSEDVKALAAKLNSLADGLPAKERELLQILIARAQSNPSASAKTEFLYLDDDIGEAIAEALDSLLKSKKKKKKKHGGGGWSRSAGTVGPKP